MAAYVTPPRNMCGTCLHPWVYPHRKVFISCNQGPLSLHHILLSGKGFAMWTVNRIPWLVKIELVQILFSQLALKSQVNGQTWYLSFFLHGQNLGRNLSPHRKCVNCDKTGLATNSMNCNKTNFATKRCKFHQKRSHNKTVWNISSIYLACQS